MRVQFTPNCDCSLNRSCLNRKSCPPSCLQHDAISEPRSFALRQCEKLLKDLEGLHATQTARIYPLNKNIKRKLDDKLETPNIFLTAYALPVCVTSP